jgi:hypothetical protein
MILGSEVNIVFLKKTKSWWLVYSMYQPLCHLWATPMNDSGGKKCDFIEPSDLS